jgi:hypothetical protein
MMVPAAAFLALERRADLDPRRRRPDINHGFHAVLENGSAVSEPRRAEANVASWWDPSGSTEC